MSELNGLNLPVAVWSAVFAAFSAIGTVLIKGWFDRRSTRDQSRHSDRELLSMDEQKFRSTLIEELTKCRDGMTKAEKAENECLQTAQRQARHINHLNMVVDRLCLKMKDVDPSFDDTDCKALPNDL